MAGWAWERGEALRKASEWRDLKPSLTSGLGDAVCAVCLEELGAGVMVARRRRYEWRVPPGGTTGSQVALWVDHAHVECALEHSDHVWEVI